jgi:hypothetical protein
MGSKKKKKKPEIYLCKLIKTFRDLFNSIFFFVFIQNLILLLVFKAIPDYIQRAYVHLLAIDCET